MGTDFIEVEDFSDLYTAERTLGKGCFGTVYLCTEKATGAKYACKCIEVEEKLEHVQREVDVMYHLAGHPNIVTIKGIYRETAIAYLVMELCEGGELFHRIVERHFYPEVEARHVMRTIISTVGACHKLGVIHRDLKPENFLFQTVDEDSVLKCGDFGLSRFFKSGEVLTEKVGSPSVIAPEVLDGKYGPEADMWSVGVIMYVLLSGAWPFSGDTTREMVKKILRKEPPSFEEEAWSTVSDGAKDLVLQLLEPNPQQRLTASEALRHPWIAECT